MVRKKKTSKKCDCANILLPSVVHNKILLDIDELTDLILSRINYGSYKVGDIKKFICDVIHEEINRFKYVRFFQ